MSEHLMVSLSQLKEHSLLVEATFRHGIESSPCWHRDSTRLHCTCLLLYSTLLGHGGPFSVMGG